nr:integrase, catalytic region, zinc finger, CCHC-type, peptidase aspartic, catalytic [Tanacetum cinerariifolium]
MMLNKLMIWMLMNSNCDELNTANVALMANLSHYGSDALAEVHNPDNMDNNMINQGVQARPSFEQSSVVNHSETKITNEQLKTQVINCTKINLDNKSVNDTLIAELERYKEHVKVLKEGQNVELKGRDNILDSCEQSVEINRLKQTLSEQIKEKESLIQTFTLLKNEFMKKESRNIDREIALENKIKQLDNIVYKTDQSAHTIYMLTKPRESFKNDFKTTRSNDFRKKVNTKPVDYAVLNQLSQDFEKQFVPQTELSAEQAFWSQNSMNFLDPSPSSTPTKVEVSKKLPKDKVKKDIEEIETINIELVHKVSKLIAKNEHLKYTYKQLYDSIKPIRVRSKEQCDALTNQVNQKSVEISDLNANLQEQGVKPSTSASGSQPSGNTKKDKIQRPPSSSQKNKVEAHLRTVKSSLKNKDCDVEPKETAIMHHFKLNANYEPICVRCNGCMLYDNHDLCVPNVINDVNAHRKSKAVKKNSKRKVWKPIGKVFTKTEYTWRPTGRTFTIVGNTCPLIRITTTIEVPLRKPTALETDAPKPVVVQIVLWYLDSGCSKHMTRGHSQLTNFVNKFLGTVKFRNEHVVKIMGYGDYQIGNVTILRVYYVEGLGHNLFSVGQFCDSNLEVAFRQHTCFIRNLEGVDLLIGSRENNMYTLSLGDMMASSLICLLSKASKTKSWLWHRRLSHLNFGAINHLARHGLVRGLPKLKFEKDHLCSACEMRKSKKKPHKPKSEDSNQEKLYLLHMDFMAQCVPQVLIKRSTFSSLSMITLDLHG